jgi:archaetidylinositol phosphate synthase
MTSENNHERLNSSALYLSEKEILDFIVRRIPENIGPNDLSIIGLAGALIAFFGFILCNFSQSFLPVAGFGIFLNWFGDSTDGTLARYRGIERPKFGYLIDHSFDLVSNALMFIGLGLSPYFTFFSSLLAISMYYLFSAYTYLKVLAISKHTLSYGGMGATELRVLLVVWAIIAAIFGEDMINSQFLGYRTLDTVICFLWTFCLCFLCYNIFRQIRDVWKD